MPECTIRKSDKKLPLIYLNEKTTIDKKVQKN